MTVTDESYDRPGFGTAFLRNFSKILSALAFGLGFFCAGWTDRRQALHDILTGCFVLRDRTVSESRLYAGALISIAFLVILLFAAARAVNEQIDLQALLPRAS